MTNMILTSECETCAHSTIIDDDKARIYVYCKVKDKKYLWGQCIPCEYKEIKREKNR